MKSVVAIFVHLVVLSQIASAAAATKEIYGRSLTEADFLQMKAMISETPKAPSRDQEIAKFKSHFKGKPPMYAPEAAFKPSDLAADVDKLKKQAATFYASGDDVEVKLQPAPLIFPPELKLSVRNLHLVDNQPKPLEVADLGAFQVGGTDWNGQNFSIYSFHLPRSVSELYLKNGSAVVTLELPKAFEVVELTLADKKKAGFELTTMNDDFVTFSFDRNDGLNFQFEALDAAGKPLQAFAIDDLKTDLMMALVAKKKWSEIPAVVSLPAKGSVTVGVHGPARKLVLYKVSASEKTEIKSSWKKSY